MKPDTRWEFIQCDEYIEVPIECIVRSGRSVKQMRKELNKEFKKLRDELLHGDQGSTGCMNPKCKVCYPYKHLLSKMNNK